MLPSDEDLDERDIKMSASAGFVRVIQIANRFNFPGEFANYPIFISNCRNRKRPNSVSPGDNRSLSRRTSRPKFRYLRIVCVGL